MTRLVAVSNRVAQPTIESKSAGGLSIGVLSALKEHGGVWFGWNGKTTDGEPGDPKIEQVGNITYATIDLNAVSFDKFYNGFSNTSLWPICHYLLGFFRFDRREYEEYRHVNTLFANKLLPLLQPDDIIWVHDYHLIPLASELRLAGIKNPIGFFLHVPFPDIEVLRVLPVYTQLLRNLCAYDVIGFHTPGDLAAFNEAINQKEIGGIHKADRRNNSPDRHFRADVFPIGIDVDNCYKLASTARQSDNTKRMIHHLHDRNLIIGVDRLDYSKGLEERFRAIERLLQNYPENRGQVSYIQIAPKTRAGIRAYDDIRHTLEQATGEINGEFADIDWIPIRYLNRAFDRPTLMEFFHEASVGLVTPIRDGMNLVAKEFVASQDPDNPGVLVLSLLAGAASELTDAVLVNPYDIDGVANGIQVALTMPLNERKERHASMIEILRRNDITTWRTHFVDALMQARENLK
ncbi:MAG: trehalose-6-phosphate synthase [Gammaproteobacteria bacterium]|jgi:trehalose 6-phosphate synthase|nr:trehalose-6-phosphate synthase [Chromatiales bacterium]MCP4926774.1 trehalose-6-phosphate synthase [Gammaproteobacteria bacterium]MDP7154408.1 trehalose-6-phosphate synthase [Gammaproteobacteria bacterium]MDP7295937.1 trehalose-6-phosphate synthase [Gammaproteobacteria bacterium]MDP7419286.1 trehalose-6-phosphate synthase [Gammaproteobacteria bacterium]